MSSPRRATSLQRVLEGQGASRDERRVLADAVPGRERGPHRVAREARETTSRQAT